MKTCCIIGHREFKQDEEAEFKIKKAILNLIKNDGVKEFLFGSKSDFSFFCYEVITEFKKVYPNISRIFVRAEYPIISNDYYNSLKEYYEDSYFYSKKLISNSFSYIRRNQVMIDKSDICLFYFNQDYKAPKKTQSGTRLAYEYALKKGKSIINVY